MTNEKSEKEVEAPPDNVDNYIRHLPRSLTIDEKKYLLAVERGDLANVRTILQIASKPNPRVSSRASKPALLFYISQIKISFCGSSLQLKYKICCSLHIWMSDF